MKRVIGLYKGELDELKSNLGRFRLRDSGGPGGRNFIRSLLRLSFGRQGRGESCTKRQFGFNLLRYHRGTVADMDPCLTLTL